MNSIRVLSLALACAFAAHADFSYTQTRKGGPAGGDTTTKHYFKGAKMKAEGAATSTITDLDAQTITSINHAQKTYTVMKFSDLNQAMKGNTMGATVEVHQTGQKKTINGYNASEVVMTMAMDSPQAGPGGMKMSMEMDMWFSSDAPGAQELRAFYQKNMDRLPWASMAGGGSASMQKAMVDMQREIAKLGGVPVLQIMKMKTGGSEAQMQQMQQGMSAARARLEEMRKQGGAQAQAAERALAQMGAMGGGSGGSLLEITMESTGFSTAPIPDSVFAIPAGYQKK